MIKRLRVTVDGHSYDVTVEMADDQPGQATSNPAPAVPAPVSPPPAAAPAPANMAKRANETGPDSEISCSPERAVERSIFPAHTWRITFIVALTLLMSTPAGSTAIVSEYELALFFRCTVSSPQLAKMVARKPPAAAKSSSAKTIFSVVCPFAKRSAAVLVVSASAADASCRPESAKFMIG